MNIVIGLPRSVKGHDIIWVVIDRQTKTTQFLLVKTTNIANQLANIYVYIQEIVKLHGI